MFKSHIGQCAKATAAILSRDNRELLATGRMRTRTKCNSTAGDGVARGRGQCWALRSEAVVPLRAAGEGQANARRDCLNRRRAVVFCTWLLGVPPPQVPRWKARGIKGKADLVRTGFCFGAGPYGPRSSIQGGFDGRCRAEIIECSQRRPPRRMRCPGVGGKVDNRGTARFQHVWIHDGMQANNMRCRVCLRVRCVNFA